MAEGADDRVARLPRAFVPDLTVAVRRARLEEAERSQSAADLRSSEIARLEMLRVALAPMFAQTGLHAGAFDHGLVAADAPKLFVDMIAYVDCGHDRRGYRFVQDTRNGPVTLAESDRAEPIVEAITMYVARRIVERERALAAVDPVRPQATARAAAQSQAPTRVPRARIRGKSALFLSGGVVGATILYALVRLGWIG